ncbi:uncharacterized protein LOC135684468 isoform X1 [Rhopilema esculentum]|uniref:uncharacterized protein LOC135684468 isoform X1 n=1 Tax=Rhopilema esculentum TaxID=499914 RepID=UPI0031D84C39
MVRFGLGQFVSHCMQMMKTLLVCVVLMDQHFLKSVTVSAANPGQLNANETKSSPSHVTSIKGSSIWLTWGYEYGGDIAGTIIYREQIIGFNSSSQAALQPVAKRTGANGALQLVPTVPAPFSGRLKVIPSNDTLVISGLKYNDTAYQFASYVITDIIAGGSSTSVKGDLRPAVRITVNGVPEFVTSPPATIEVNENTNLEIAIEMDGNPAPSADFLWPHLGDGGTTVAGSQIYPYVYSAKFSHPNIAAGYCGRILKSSVKNSIGSSLAKDTNVTVLLKLDGNPNLRAGKIIIDSCVEVKWTKAESGACYVKYEVKLKNASGTVVYTETGYNIDEVKKCKIPGNVNITDVEMTMSFKTTSKVFTAKVSETPIPTTLPPTTTSKTSKTPDTTSPGPTKNIDSLSSSSEAASLSTVKVTKPKDPGKQSGTPIGAVIGGAFGGLIVLILLIVLIIYLKKRSKAAGKKDLDSGEPGYPLQDEDVNYSTAGSGQVKRDPYEPTYADPKGQPVVYGKLGAGGGRKGPKPSKREDESNYADVKVDEHGYPAVGAVPTSYTDGYGQSRSGSRGGERDSGRRVAPDRRAPPPYNDTHLDDDGYPVSRHIPPVYAQVNKPKKQR